MVALLVAALGAKSGSAATRDVLPPGIVVVKDARDVLRTMTTTFKLDRKPKG